MLKPPRQQRHQVMLRLLPEEDDQIIAAAIAAHLPRGTWMREVLVREAQKANERAAEASAPQA